MVVVRGAVKKIGRPAFGSAGVGSALASRPSVTRRTQVHLCRAVAGIKVPTVRVRGARRVENNSPRAQSAHCSATSIMPRCSQEPVSQLPARRARTHTQTHTHTEEFAPAEAGGGCVAKGLGEAGGAGVGGEGGSQASLSKAAIQGWAFSCLLFLISSPALFLFSRFSGLPRAHPGA